MLWGPSNRGEGDAVWIDSAVPGSRNQERMGPLGLLEKSGSHAQTSSCRGLRTWSAAHPHLLQTQYLYREVLEYSARYSAVGDTWAAWGPGGGNRSIIEAGSRCSCRISEREGTYSLEVGGSCVCVLCQTVQCSLLSLGY